jgi:hypothetical protein
LLANLTYVGSETTTLYTNTDGTMLNFKAGAVYNIELTLKNKKIINIIYL